MPRGYNRVLVVATQVLEGLDTNDQGFFSQLKDVYGG